MDAFEPCLFGEFASTAVARKLWAFLNHEEQVIRLVVASELGHAALDGVVERLEMRFGSALDDHRTRQLVGAMIRQVMAGEGWVMDKTGIKVRRGERFSVAARYANRS